MKLTVYAPSLVFARSYLIAAIMLVAAGLLHFFQFAESIERGSVSYVAVKLLMSAYFLVYAATLVYFARFKYKRKAMGTLELTPSRIRFTDKENRTHLFPLLGALRVNIALYVNGSPWRIVLRAGEGEQNEQEYSLAPLCGKEKETLKSLLEQWYRNGVQVREFDLQNRRAFLLQCGLKFKQIQEIKKKYYLAW